jgi:CubicO group peptidase (beta-lactamase class C family)
MSITAKDIDCMTMRDKKNQLNYLMKLNFNIIILLFCVLSLPSSAQRLVTHKDDPRFIGLDTALQHVLKTWHAAGLAVAIVEKDQVIYSKGFGYRDIASKLSVTPNTLFLIASCTKAFTASLVGKLQQEDKVDIDRPVVNYLPSLKFYNAAMNNTITLRDMMSHRTGLARHDLSWYFFNTNSTDSLVHRIQYLEPTYSVRQKWQYNNFMYMAIGAVVQHLTGKSWEDNVKEDFFAPMDMSHSCVNVSEIKKNDDYATGYDLFKDIIIRRMNYYDNKAMGPAGAIGSSVNDMAKWVIVWINNGKYQEKEIIPAHFRDAAISSQAIVDGALPGKSRPDVYFSNYGFGWFLASYKGHYRVEHGGNIDGFSASTSFFPADSIGIVVLTNQDDSPVPDVVRNLIADRALNLKYHDWNTDLKNAVGKNKQATEKAKKAAVTSAVEHKPATHILFDFAGSYNNPGYGSMKLYLKNDSLFIQTPTHELWLRHANYDIFDVFDARPGEEIDTSNAKRGKIQFHMNLDGDIDGLSTQFESTLKSIWFNKQTIEKLGRK